MTYLATRIPAGDYAAIVKPRLARAHIHSDARAHTLHDGRAVTPAVTHHDARNEGRTRAGVILVLKPPLSEDTLQTYHFASWSFVRERLRVFGLATPEELDSADVRLSTGRQPYMFSVRRWQAPLIEALDLNYSEF